MALYSELFDKLSDSNLRNRVAIAVVKEAHGLLSSSPTADQQKWAADVFMRPKYWGGVALLGVLAANSSASVAQINSATDTQIQSNVAALADALTVAFNAQV